MVTVTCQYTGIQFEAKSARTKNHPLVSQLLADAHKHGTYGVAVEMLAVAKEAGMSDIHEIVAFAFANMCATEQKRFDELEARKREMKAQRQRRREVNETLRANGYRWRRVNVAEEMDAFGPLAWADYGDDNTDWDLISPTGSIVTVGEALAEIVGRKNNGS